MYLLAATWWDWLIGSDPDAKGSPVLKWANFPESWGVFVLIFVVLAIGFGVFWLYRREMDTCPKPIKLTLAALRLAVLLFLVALYLKPSVFFQQVNEIKRNVSWLRDGSLSVAKSDIYRDSKTIEQLAAATGLEQDVIRSGAQTRAALLNSAVAKSRDAIDVIRSKGGIEVLDFSDDVKSVALLPSQTGSTGSDAPAETENPNSNSSDATGGTLSDTIPPLQANGLGTDIWQALRASLEKPEKLSAILLISDFQHNGSEDPIELARKAAALGIPIFGIGLGDPNPPRNITVSEVYVRNKAYPNEPFEIEGLVQVNNLSGELNQLNIELRQQRIDPRTGAPGDFESVTTKAFPVPDSGGRIRVDFEHVLELPGKYVFSLAAEKLVGEIDIEDNLRTSSEMEVVDEKVKVLLISGLPSWDYQQVQRLLQRDQNISLSCFLQSMDETRPQEGNEPIERLPETMEELREYNVIVMMDPNPGDFDLEWCNMVKNFCKERAGGLLYMAGPQFTTEFMTLNKLSGMRELLPVRFGDLDFIDANQILAKANSNLVEMSVIRHNLDHPVMSFRAEPGENQKLWESLPGVFWSFPARNAKPTSRVLLENTGQVNADGNQPLMVAGRYGAGAVLYMGFQGTWRWRRVGLQAQYFDRFWIQVIRYLVETRSLQGSRRGFLDTDKSEYELGDRILLVARVLDPQFQPSNEPAVTAIVTSGDGRERKVTLKKLPQQEGRYEGSFIAQRTGNYDATIAFPEEDETGSLVEPIAFRVVTPNAESRAFWLNQKMMNDITSISGGKSFRLDQMDELAEVIPEISEKLTFRSPLRPLWDMNWLLRMLAFSLPVLLLCIEWAIRKWYKLL